MPRSGRAYRAFWFRRRSWCVSFDNDGAPEAIDDGRTGLLARLGGRDALADRVIQLCNDAELRVSMGRAARAHCAERFDVQKMVSDISNLYDGLMAKTSL